MSGEWISWGGGNCPIAGDVIVEYKMRDSDITSGPNPADFLRWGNSGSSSDIIAYRVVGETVKDKPAPTISDGSGSTEYYKLTIKNRAGEEFSCEMGDIIRYVFGNDFDLGNVVKAARRMYLAKQGKGKEGTSIEYDAKKIEYFTQEFVHWSEVA